MKFFKKLMVTISLGSFIRKAGNLKPEDGPSKAMEVAEMGLKATNMVIATFEDSSDERKAMLSAGAGGMAIALVFSGMMESAVDAARVSLDGISEMKRNGKAPWIDEGMIKGTLGMALGRLAVSKTGEEREVLIKDAKICLSAALSSCSDDGAASGLWVEKALTLILSGEEQEARNALERAFRMGGERAVSRAKGVPFDDDWRHSFVPAIFAEMSEDVAKGLMKQNQARPS